MNERIKELWTEAAKSTKDDSWESQTAFIERFAGLIVLECMEVFSRDLPEPGDGKMPEVINRVCAVAEHFGVES